MKKKLSYLGIMVLSLFLMSKVEAATTVSVSASKSSVVVGNTVTVTVTYTSSNIIGQLYGTFSYNSSIFKYVSGSQPSISWTDVNNEKAKSKTYTYTLKAIASGTSNFTVTDASVYLLDAGDSLAPVNPSIGSASTKVITQSQLEATYSKNNNLSNLTIDGAVLDPVFSADVLEYNVELPNGTESININATKADGSASVSGAGTVTVTEGINKIEIKVTAQNGNEKIYVINVTVKELDPVTVKINNKEYTVVRKDGVMEVPSSTYEKTTTSVNGVDVLAYNSNITDYTLVGLKDSTGKTDYYLYQNNKFTLYKEYTFNGITLNITEAPKDKIPSNYQKTTFTYNEDKITSYKVDTNKIKTTYAIGEDYNFNNSEFYLFYALNVETGEDNLYLYDKKENTVQRYSSSEVDFYKDKADKYFILVIALGGIIALGIITLSIILIKNGKKSHKNK